MNNKLTFLLIFALSISSSLFAECNFGLLVPTTGEYASTGEGCTYGQQVASERHADKQLPVKFIIEDSKAQGREAVNLFKKLVELDKVQAIELIRSTVGMAINPLSKKAEIPIIGAVGHPKFISENPYAFQYWPSTNDESKKLVEALIADGNKHAYSLSAEDDWLLAFQADFNHNLEELSGQVVDSDAVEPTFSDFKSLILKIKKSQADSIFVSFGPTQLNIFVKQFREAGLTQKIYTTFYAKSEDVLNVLSKENLEGIVFVEVNARQPIFLEKYTKLSNHKIPSAVSYSCYLTTESLYEACSQHLQTGKSFQEILLNIKSVSTYDQLVSVDERQAKFEISVMTFDDGKIKFLN